MNLTLHPFKTISFLVSILLVFLSNSGLNAQDVETQTTIPKIKIKGQLNVIDGNPAGTKVILKLYGEEIQNVELKKTGKFSFDFELNSDYELLFLKNDFVTKTIGVQTHVPDDVLENNPNFPDFLFEVSIFKKYEGIDVEIFAIQNAGEINFNKKIDNFEFVDFHLDDNVLEEIDQRMKQKSLEEKQYADAIAEASDLTVKKKYAEAQNAYKTALAVRPGDETATKKIAELDLLIMEENRLRAQNDVIEEQYKSAIKWGESSIKDQKYTEAVAAFTKALEVKIGDKYATTQLREAKRLLSNTTEAVRVANLERYRQKVEDANNALKLKDFDQAEALFTEAQTLDPDATYPKQMLEKMVDLKKEAEKDAADHKVKEDWYRVTLAKADNFFDNKNYKEAKETYLTVIKYQKDFFFKQDDPYARNRIVEIDKITLHEQKKMEEETFNRQQYEKAIVEADDAFNQKKFKAAQTAYNKALIYRPDDVYANDRIAESARLMEEATRLRAESEKMRGQYDKIIASADVAYNRKNYDEAKQLYKSALELISDEPYPQQRLEGIDNLIAEQKLKLEAEQKLDADYKDAISSADLAFADKKWDEARAFYFNATKIKPNLDYPKKQVNEIEKLIAADNKALAEQRAKDEAYDNALNKANETFYAQDYLAAQQQYKVALSLKPNEQVPTERLKEIDAIFAQRDKAEQQRLALEQNYKVAIADGEAKLAAKKFEEALVDFQKATELKPKEAYPQQKIKDVNNLIEDRKKAEAEQKAIEDNYNRLIALADESFKKADFKKARASYSEALNVKPQLKYPMEQIAEIDKIVAQENQRLAKELAAEEAYQQEIVRADDAFKANRYKEALRCYEIALKLKPNEKMPAEKINQLNDLIAQQEKMEAEKKEIDKAYNIAIAKAENLFKDKKYKEAKAEFAVASGIKPSEIMPKQRIEDIDKLLAQTEFEFNDAIKKGDDAFDANNFSVAEFYYKKAYVLRAESYIQDKINNSLNKAQELKNNEKIAEYQETVVKADVAFDKNEFSVAEFYYKKALELKDDSYPKQKILEIEKAREQSKLLATEAEYRENINQGDKALTTKDYGVAKFYYEKALLIRAKDEYATQKLHQLDMLIQQGKTKGD